MIIWMPWSMLFTALIGVAAIALERAIALIGGPRRYIWMAALVAGAVLPLVLAVSHPRQVVAHAVSEAASADAWVTRLWLLSSLVVLIVLVRTVRALAHRSSAWPEAAVGPCRALISPHEGPAVIGFARPRVVLPEWALSLEQSARELMLRHELEHIRAGDPRSLFMVGIVLIALPWNAGLWWIAKRLRFAMELDCDARVVRAVGSRRDYALMLVAVGERHLVPPPLAASLAEPPMLLERRIEAMMKGRARRPLLAALPLVAAAALVLIAVFSAPRPPSLRSVVMSDQTVGSAKSVALSTAAATPPETAATPGASSSARAPAAPLQGFRPSPIMRRLSQIAWADAGRARRGSPLATTAIADFQDALAETVRDTTQASMRGQLDEALGRFTIDMAKKAKDTAAKQLYVQTAKQAFTNLSKDPGARWAEAAADGLVEVAIQSGDTASVRASYVATLNDPGALYLDVIKAGFAADIAARAGLNEARVAEVELFRKAASMNPSGGDKLFTVSVALAADSGSAARPLIDRLMIVDPSNVTNTRALHGVYALLQTATADEEDHYTALANAASKQSDSIASKAYSDSAHAWDDSSRVLDKEFSDFLLRGDSALVGVEVASWRPKNGSVQVAGTMTNWTTTAKSGTMHVAFVNAGGQTVSTADVPFAIDRRGTQSFTVTGTGDGIVSFKSTLPH